MISDEPFTKDDVFVLNDLRNPQIFKRKFTIITKEESKVKGIADEGLKMHVGTILTKQSENFD